MLAISFTWWPWFTRLVYGEVLSRREEPYVEAARALGQSDGVVLIREILPNVVSPIVVKATLDVSFVILLGSVPLAMFGALLFTFLRIPDPNTPFWTTGWTTTLNIYAQVGLVTLVGLIAKNGILVVEFANKLQEEGRSKIDAVREAAKTRLRPVLMTTVATIAGHFPLTLVSGPGAAARNSIGLVLVGGMAIGALFTLFVLPSVYVLLAKDHAKDRVSVPESLPADAEPALAK